MVKMPALTSNLFRDSRQTSESISPLSENRCTRGPRYGDVEDPEDVESNEDEDEDFQTSLLKDGAKVRESRLPSHGSFYLQRPGPLWWRKLRHGLASIGTIPAKPNAKPEEQSGGGILYFEPAVSRKSKLIRVVVYFALIFFLMLGIVKFVSLLAGAIVAFFPEYLDLAIDTWGKPGQMTEDYAHWPTDFSRDIQPVPCHSHNDYWRKVPLFSALKAGCVSVEADVWLYDDELYVGHSTSSLTRERTLRNLYINPLLDILARQNAQTPFHQQPSVPLNGVFDTNSSQPLILLIDFKNSGRDIWPVVVSQLEPLRSKGYLTHYNGTVVLQGPITVVATGNAPFDLLTANTTYRDIFFDAPIDVMAEVDPDEINRMSTQSPASTDLSQDPPPPPSSDKPSTRSDQGQGHTGLPSDPASAFNPTNSYYASVSFKKSIGYVWGPSLTAQQIDLIRAQIRGAHARSLKVRYWGTPGWPRGLRNYVWRVLVEEGVDMLNVDDLEAATGVGWRERGKGWWWR